jgi:DNA-3-methyladenine glycosylase II
MWKEAELFLKKDKHIGPLMQKWGHCTIKPTKSNFYFEDLVNAICSQQLSGKAADTIFKKVKKTLVTIAPDSILLKTDQELRDCGLSWQKIKYLNDLSEKVKSKSLILSNIDKKDDEEIIESLTKVKGIGRWTAEMFLMFSLGRPDVLPKNDLGINNAIKKLKIKQKDTDKWRPYRTVVAWYLWKSLENR